MVIVSAAGRILALNRRFAQMWPIPDDVIASKSDPQALQSVLDKLVDPETFLTRVGELYDRATGTSRDELHLLDSRVFDRHGSALHDEDGGYVGWAWYFRDVTTERAAAVDAARMGGLVAVARDLGDARTELDVLDVVAGLGAATLGAQTAVLCLDEPDLPFVRALTNSFFGDDVRRDIAELPRDFPLPMIAVATGGPELFLVDRGAAAQLYPPAEEIYRHANIEGSAAVPLRFGGGILGSMAVAFEAPHAWRPEDRRLLDALASLTAQALGRILAQQAEQSAALAVRRMAETLQRSLLSAPPASDGLQVAVRYQAAAQEAQVGGDWYDAFEREDGTLTLVVGDVAGHDRAAAATMAQCRNVLRGVAQTLQAAPAAVLTAFDVALTALHVDAMATAVLCQVHRLPGGGATLAWSNAGHPPPVLLHADGTARLLDTAPDLLLGMQQATERGDHELTLPAGSTLVLYTDGLIERKQQDIDEGIDRLIAAVASLHGAGPDRLCDALLEQLGASTDDVALLVLHIPG